MNPNPGFMLLKYEDMKGMCNAFVERLMVHVKSESNEFELQRLGHATGELFELLKDKYNIPVLDAAVLLLSCGIDLLNQCDTEIDKARRHDEGI